MTMAGGMSYTVPTALNGSVQFNGTTQYLSTTGATGDAIDLAAGAGNWTVECWFYLNNVTTNQAIFWKGGATGTTNPSYCFQLSNTTGQWIVGDGGGGGTAIAPSTVFAINTWYHFALVRNGSTLTSYTNGVQSATTTMAFTMSNTGNNNLSIANSSADGSSRPMAGYISNFRITKGVAVYTSNFTPSTGPLTITQAANVNGNPSAAITGTQTSLLLSTPNNASFITNTSSFSYTMTNNGTSTSSPLNPFSPGSISFNGSNQRLSLPASSAFDLSGGTWTIEFWMYSTATPTVGNQCRIFMFGTNGSASAFDIGYNNDGTISAVVPSGSPPGIVSAVSAITLNNWYHVAVVSNAGSGKIFINGTQSGSTTTPTQPTSSSPTLFIGYDTPATADFQYQGYLSNIRIVKGTAVYTSNFTPPAGPATSTQYINQNGNPAQAITGTQTSLLLNTQNGTNAFIDDSTNGFTVTNVGGATSQSFNPFGLPY